MGSDRGERGPVAGDIFTPAAAASRLERLEAREESLREAYGPDPGAWPGDECARLATERRRHDALLAAGTARNLATIRRLMGEGAGEAVAGGAGDRLPMSLVLADAVMMHSLRRAGHGRGTLLVWSGLAAGLASLRLEGDPGEDLRGVLARAADRLLADLVDFSIECPGEMALAWVRQVAGEALRPGP